MLLIHVSCKCSGEYLPKIQNNFHLFVFLKKFPELKSRKSFVGQVYECKPTGLVGLGSGVQVQEVSQARGLASASRGPDGQAQSYGVRPAHYMNMAAELMMAVPRERQGGQERPGFVKISSDSWPQKV